jgi:hypothetical protein
MCDKEPYLPLRWIVSAWLSASQYATLHHWLLGDRPERPSRYICPASRCLNYHTLHDIYLLVMWSLALSGIVLVTHVSGRIAAFAILIAVTLRLHEVATAVLRVSLKVGQVERKKRPTERTFAIAALVYLEPILLFGIMHAAMPSALGLSPDTVYAHLEGSKWDTPSLVYYSVACYTTVGWGDIYPRVSEAKVLSGAETLFGVLLLVCTISAFVAKLDGP